MLEQLNFGAKSTKWHPWEVNSSSSNQKTIRILWRPKVHYRVHNSLPSVPIPSHINPVRAITSSFWKINFNITFHLAISRFKWSFSYRFPQHNHTCISILSHVRPILCSGRFPWSDHPNMWWGVQVNNLLIMKFWCSSVQNNPLKIVI
jgi:uncharacterized Zn-finger protein